MLLRLIRTHTWMKSYCVITQSDRRYLPPATQFLNTHYMFFCSATLSTQKRLNDTHKKPDPIITCHIHAHVDRQSMLPIRITSSWQVWVSVQLWENLGNHLWVAIWTDESYSIHDEPAAVGATPNNLMTSSVLTFSIFVSPKIIVLLRLSTSLSSNVNFS